MSEQNDKPETKLDPVAALADHVECLRRELEAERERGRGAACIAGFDEAVERLAAKLTSEIAENIIRPCPEAWELRDLARDHQSFQCVPPGVLEAVKVARTSVAIALAQECARIARARMNRVLERMLAEDAVTK